MPAYETKVFRLSLAAALSLHLAAVGLLILAGLWRPAPEPRVLGEWTSEIYDPLGGAPGGGAVGVGEEEAAEQVEPEPAKPVGPEIVEPEQAEPDPEKPEPAEPENITLIEGRAEEAAPAPPVKREDTGPPKPALKKPVVKKPVPPAGRDRVEKNAGEAGGSGGGSGRGEADALKAYKAKLVARLNRFKKYPPEAAARNIVGVVMVTFTVNRQGEVLNARLARGSGQLILDQEAQALLRRVNPFPPMPPELPQASLTLTAPIQFSRK